VRPGVGRNRLRVDDHFEAAKEPDVKPAHTSSTISLERAVDRFLGRFRDGRAPSSEPVAARHLIERHFGGEGSRPSGGEGPHRLGHCIRAIRTEQRGCLRVGGGLCGVHGGSRFVRNVFDTCRL
jgi:hypothetical protein